LAKVRALRVLERLSRATGEVPPMPSPDWYPPDRRSGGTSMRCTSAASGGAPADVGAMAQCSLSPDLADSIGESFAPEVGLAALPLVQSSSRHFFAGSALRPRAAEAAAGCFASRLCGEGCSASLASALPLLGRTAATHGIRAPGNRLSGALCCAPGGLRQVGHAPGSAAGRPFEVPRALLGGIALPRCGGLLS
jgi:hypothetical protein